MGVFIGYMIIIGIIGVLISLPTKFFVLSVLITILLLTAFVLHSVKKKGINIKELWLDSVKEGEEMLSHKVDSSNAIHKDKN